MNTRCTSLACSSSNRPRAAGPDFIRDLHETIVKNDDFQPTFRKHPGKCSAASPTSPGRSTTTSTSTITCAGRRLPRPGRVRELLELTSRLHGTLLDRHRPLWEAHLVEGLDDGRFAVYTKIHHSLLDGVSRSAPHGPLDDAGSRRPRDPGAVDARPEAQNQGLGASRGRLLQSITGAVGSVASLAPSALSRGQGRAAGTATDPAVSRAQDDVQRADRRSAPRRRAIVAAGADPRHQVRGRRHRQRRRAGHVRGSAARLPHRTRRAAGHAAGRDGSGQPARGGRAGRGRQHGRHDSVQPGHRHRRSRQAARRDQHVDARQQEGVRRAAAKTRRWRCRRS